MLGVWEYLYEYLYEFLLVNFMSIFIVYKMERSFVLFCLLVALCDSSMKISNDPTLYLWDPIWLECTGYQGNVIFWARNLPSGVAILDNKLYINDPSRVIDGSYYIHLIAIDSLGQKDQKIIVVILHTPKNPIQNKNQVAQPPTKPLLPNETQNSQKKQDSQKLTQILDSLSLPSNINQNQYKGGYPVPTFPTGSNTDIISIQSNYITTNQATTSTSHRNIPTADQLRGNQISERQLQATKALVNLLSIIKQSKSNLNTIKSQITQLNTILATTKQNKRQSELKVQQLDSTAKKVRSGITQLTNQTNQIKNQIQNLTIESKSKQLQKQALNRSIDYASGKLRALLSEESVGKIREANLKRDIGQLKVECEGFAEEYTEIQGELEDQRILKQNVVGKIKQAQYKVKVDAQKVQELQKQLAGAYQQLKNSKNSLQNLTTQSEQYSSNITRMNHLLQTLSQKLIACKEQLKTKSQQLNKIEQILKNLLQQKLAFYSELAKIKKQKQQIDQLLLKDIPGKIAEKQVEMAAVQERLQYLRSQVVVLEKNLIHAYSQVAQAEAALKKAQEDLNAAISSSEKQQAIIDSATLNLQKARIQKDQADLEVEKYMKEGADLLPYAAAPDNVGAQYNQQQKYYEIQGWNQFVGDAYGPTIKPIFIGTLKNLYSFKLNSQQQQSRNTALTESLCPKTNLIAFSGYVVGSTANTIQVIDNIDGYLFQAQIQDCTLSLANLEGYVMRPGDIILVKGQKPQKNILKATQITCIQK